MKCNQFRPGFELVSPCLCPTTITITPRAPPASLCWSSAHLVQCGPDEPCWTLIQIWIQARMPDYSLNWTARSSAIQRRQRCQWWLCWTVLASIKINSKLRLSASTPEQVPFYSWKGSNLLWCERDRWRHQRRRETAILNLNFFFSWPYYAVLPSRPPLSTSASRPGAYSSGGPLWAAFHAGCPATHWRSLWLTESLLIATWD